MIFFPFDCAVTLVVVLHNYYTRNMIIMKTIPWSSCDVLLGASGGRAHGDGSEELLGEVGDEFPDDGGRLVTEAVVGQRWPTSWP